MKVNIESNMDDRRIQTFQIQRVWLSLPWCNVIPSWDGMYGMSHPGMGCLGYPILDMDALDSLESSCEVRFSQL